MRLRREPLIDAASAALAASSRGRSPPPSQLAFVDVDVLQLQAETRDELDDALEQAHPAQHLLRLEEVVGDELPRADARLHRRLLVLLDRLPLPAFSINVRTSPIPRIRDAIRSGWNHSIWSTFSPIDTSLIGLPVTARIKAQHRPERLRPAS